MTGSGNDFVMVDARVSAPADWAPEDIRAVCARGTGVGADGLVFVGPGSAAGAVRMIYYNSDGSHAAMCGNAALCSTALAIHLNLGQPDGMDLETDAGIYRGRGAGAGRAELHLAPVQAPTAVAGLDLVPGEQQAALGIVGVPHLIVLVDDVDRVDLAGRGRALRFHPALAAGGGANINFISRAGSAGSAGSGEGEGPGWRMRTYERGIEGETLACGTGAVAATCALEQWGLSASPVHIVTRSGCALRVRVTRTARGDYDDVWLTGEGRIVFSGVLT